MVVTCHACQTKFRVDDAKIGTRGVKVRCSKCQTMIIVKPEAQTMEDNPTAVGAAPPATMALARGDGPPPAVAPPEPAAPPMPQVPASFDDEEREPTRVMQAPLMSQMIQQSSERTEPAMPVAPPQMTPPLAPPPLAPPPTAAQRPPPAMPPPMAAPPPLKAPAPGPSLDAAIGAEKPAGAWQTSAPTPASAAEAAPAPAAALGDDLFSDPFANPPPAAPPVAADDSAQQRFADIAPSAGPSLELDLPQSKKDGPTSMGSDDPLAGMPKFEDPGDEGPTFEGGISEEGMVTKPTALAAMETPRAPPPQPELELATKKEAAAPVAIAQTQTRRKSAGNRKAVAIVGYAAIILLVVAGLFGEYMLFRAGGYDGLVGHADRLRAPDALGIELRRVHVAPYVSKDGRPFVIVRGELHNKNSATSPPVAVDIQIGGQKVSSAAPGAAIDATALYRDARIEVSGPTSAPLAANETKIFAVAIAAPKDPAALKETLEFAISAR